MFGFDFRARGLLFCGGFMFVPGICIFICELGLLANLLDFVVPICLLSFFLFDCLFIVWTDY